MTFYFSCQHKEQSGCTASKSIQMECSSWEPAALQEKCKATKLAAVGSDNVDVARDLVIKQIKPHTCIEHNPAQGTVFDTKEELCDYVLQQVLLIKTLPPNKGMYQKLEIHKTIAFCEEKSRYNAASSNGSPLDSTQGM